MAVILILLGILLIVFSSYSILKENINEKSDNNSFSNVLRDKEDGIDERDITIGEIRREFAETITDLQMEILDLKERMNLNDDLAEAETEEHETDVSETEETESKVLESGNEEKTTFNGVKINDLDRLLKEGYSLDEISKNLDISKGEILLIKDLYLK